MITKREFDMLVLLTETKEVVSQRDMAERLNISAEAVNKTCLLYTSPSPRDTR